eukprot:sb/3471033/
MKKLGLMGPTPWVFLILLGTALSALECEWEKKEKTYLPSWTSNAGSTRYTTLAEAQAKCVTLGTNCGGITLMSNGYTLRAGSGFVNYDHETSWKKLGCPVASDKVFKVNSISPGQGSRQGGTRITISGQVLVGPMKPMCLSIKELHVSISNISNTSQSSYQLPLSIWTRPKQVNQPIRDQDCLIRSVPALST